jgi:hypothetical protein
MTDTQTNPQLRGGEPDQRDSGDVEVSGLRLAVSGGLYALTFH